MLDDFGNLSEELASRPSKRRNWARHLVPNLAVCLSWAAIFYSIFLFHASRQLFRDSDTGWHIRAGESILSTLTLPGTDPYSFSRHDQPWFDWEWGSDVIMGAVHRAAGLSGITFLFVCAIALVVWLWARLNWAAGGNFFITAILAAPMLSTTNLHWLARPHIFSWVLLLVALLYLESAQTGFRWRQALFLAGLGTLWANLHASFFLLPLIALLYAVGHLIRPLLWNLDPGQEFRRARWFSLAAAFSLAGTVLNPYGIGLHAHVLEYLANKELLDRVGEFQTFNFHVDGASQLLFMLGIAALGGVLAVSQKKVGHFLLAALFLAIALRSARGLPVAALVLLPLANGSITEALRRARELRSSVRRGLRSALQYSDRLRLLDARYSGLIWSPLIAILVFGWLRIPMIAADTGFPLDQFPVYAAGELTLLPSNARLFAPDKYGGYLIYRFNGRFKVFFDGRSDFYGSGFMKQYIRLIEVRPGWREQLNAWGFTHALLPAEFALAPALEGLGWKELYRDEVAVLLQRPER